MIHLWYLRDLILITLSHLDIIVRWREWILSLGDIIQETLDERKMSLRILNFSFNFSSHRRDESSTNETSLFTFNSRKESTDVRACLRLITREMLLVNLQNIRVKIYSETPAAWKGNANRDWLSRFKQWLSSPFVYILADDWIINRIESRSHICYAFWCLLRQTKRHASLATQKLTKSVCLMQIYLISAKRSEGSFVFLLYFANVLIERHTSSSLLLINCQVVRNEKCYLKSSPLALEEKCCRKNNLSEICINHFRSEHCRAR